MKPSHLLIVVLVCIFAVSTGLDALDRHEWQRFKAQHACEKGETNQAATQWNCAKGLTLWKGPQYE